MYQKSEGMTDVYLPPSRRHRWPPGQLGEAGSELHWAKPPDPSARRWRRRALGVFVEGEGEGEGESEGEGEHVHASSSEKQAREEAVEVSTNRR